MVASGGTGVGKDALPVIAFTMACACVMRAGTLGGSLRDAMDRWTDLGVVLMGFTSCVRSDRPVVAGASTLGAKCTGCTGGSGRTRCTLWGTGDSETGGT